MLSFYSYRFLKSILTICFVLLIQQVHSQNKEIDSLKIALKKQNENDTLRVNILNKLALSYSKKDISQTLNYVQEADALSKKLKYESGQAKCLYIKGIIAIVGYNYNLALNHFNNSIKIYDRLDHKSGLSECYNAIGILYYNKEDYEKAITNLEQSIKIDKQLGQNFSAALMNLANVYADYGNNNKAIQYYIEALKINKEAKDWKSISSCYNNLGTIYDDISNYPLALEYYHKSLEIDERNNDSLKLHKVLNNIGIIYKKRENYDKALAYYNRALKILNNTGEKIEIAKVQMNIGIVYKNKKQFEEAKKIYAQALKIIEDVNSQKTLANCFNNLGDVYLETNDFKQAFQNYENAKNINIKIGNQIGLCNAYLGTASVYEAQNQNELALKNALSSLAISKKLGLLDFEKDAQELLFIIYKKEGKYRQALAHHELFKALSDSLLNEENIEKLTQLEYEHKYAKQLDVAGKREQKLTKTVLSTSQDLEKSQGNLLLGIITFLAMAIVLSCIIFFLKLRNSKSKTENIITEQKLLRSQMTPHFIFNSLSVLQGMILNKEESKSVSYLSKFSKLLRITLENSRDKTVVLSKELEAVENYLLLQNIENEKIDFNLLVDKEIEINTIKVPPMLIQPFVENAIEHAFKNRNEKCSIEINLTLVDSKLICTIVDNGMGIDSSVRNQNKHKKSLATKITSERLQYLSKDFKMKGCISIEDRSNYNEQGTKVTIQIPYLKQEL